MGSRKFTLEFDVDSKFNNINKKKKEKERKGSVVIVHNRKPPNNRTEAQAIELLSLIKDWKVFREMYTLTRLIKSTRVTKRIVKKYSRPSMALINRNTLMLSRGTVINTYTVGITDSKLYKKIEVNRYAKSLDR